MFSSTKLSWDGAQCQEENNALLDLRKCCRASLGHTYVYIAKAAARNGRQARPPHSTTDLLESARRGGAPMKLDLLAIAAHPDDVELTCGGTLLKMARRGYKTGILDLTAGEMGTRGTPETRAKEAAKAAKILGVAWRGTLGVPDSDVQPARQHKLKLASVIREVRPKIVILPYWQARHPDHYHAATLGYEGCFLAGLKQLPIEGEPYRPFKILYSTSYADVRPTFVVDITKEFAHRRKAILAFGSQFRPAKGAHKSKVFLAIDCLEDEMNHLARHYGQMIGVKYGEPFLTKELMQVEDVVAMHVRSI
jgi:bacillithiol biosynthesis deacetylase BshB1